MALAIGAISPVSSGGLKSSAVSAVNILQPQSDMHIISVYINAAAFFKLMLSPSPHINIHHRLYHSRLQK